MSSTLFTACTTLSCLALACAQRAAKTIAPQSRRGVSITTDVTHFANFPQVTDSSRVLPGGAVRAATDVPSCHVALVGDTLQWRRQATTVRSRFLTAITLRLPSEFAVAPIDTSDLMPEDLTQPWEHILGSFDAFTSRRPGIPGADLAFWIGPSEGYPISGIGGGEVRQVAYTECLLATAMGTIPVALFHVDSPVPAFRGFHVATYWQLEPGVYVRGAGSGPDSLDQVRLLTALLTLQVDR